MAFNGQPSVLATATKAERVVKQFLSTPGWESGANNATPAHRGCQFKRISDAPAQTRIAWTLSAERRRLGGVASEPKRTTNVRLQLRAASAASFCKAPLGGRHLNTAVPMSLSLQAADIVSSTYSLPTGGILPSRLITYAPARWAMCNRA